MLTMDQREAEAGDGSFQHDPRWAAVTEITASGAFSKATRLSELLLYLARQAILGRATVVTEAELAAGVFGRGKDFDPAADTIVRSHMLRLRQRLAQVNAPTRGFVVSLPKGQYALTFEEVAEPRPFVEDPVPEPSPVPPAVSLAPTMVAKVPLQWPLYALLLVLLLLSGTDLVYRLQSRRLPGTNSPLWDRLFTPDRTTTFVAADSSLVLLHHYMPHEPTLAEYTSGRFRQDAEVLYRSGVEPSGLFERRYTSMADLKMTRLLGEIAGARHIRMGAVFARDTTLDVLKQNNIVLSGSKGANPWLELFEPQLNFNIENDADRHATVVTNRHPRGSESSEYLTVGASSGTYGVLAFIPGIEPSTNVLILEGTSVAGTESIYDLLSNDEELKELLKQFRAPDGHLLHFEVLLDCQNLNGSAAKFRVVASRSYT